MITIFCHWSVILIQQNQLSYFSQLHLVNPNQGIECLHAWLFLKNLSFSPLFMIKCNNVESALFSPLSYYYHGQNVDIIKEMAYSCLSGALRKHIVSLEFSDHFPDFLLHFCKIFFLLRVRSHQLHSRQ